MAKKNKNYSFDIKKFISTAIEEDAPWGDISSEILVPKSLKARGKVFSKGDYIVSGLTIAKAIYRHVDSKVEFRQYFKDGDTVSSGDTIFEVSGRARSLLLCERLSLNIMSRMMGIASKTRKILDSIKTSKAKILDTRKTTPGIRLLEKMAVKDGGGMNHRFCLSDAVLAKENHVAIAGGLKSCLEKLSKARSKLAKNTKVEIEVRSLNEFKQVLDSPFKPDIVMLDNMDLASIKKAVKLNKGPIKLEVSGGVNESNVISYAQTGVDYISIGALTHSVQSADISFLLTTVDSSF